MIMRNASRGGVYERVTVNGREVCLSQVSVHWGAGIMIYTSCCRRMIYTSVGWDRALATGERDVCFEPIHNLYNHY
jgi:hypothetical protein